ncbi:hypothetical protein [Legionella resiliens]|uniref:Uncharacterized protein n=1 Tax=Legionella resiliens TaxID=2905958 RepID=A0ABS8X3B6_9GAMM|nr:hypothetical protein [Legionella sp. 8cVS16]MCE3531755.1 hypothetical protein [Legionella sp. 8cVS16]
MLKGFLSSGVVLGLYMSTAFANMFTNSEQFRFIGGDLGLNSVINKSTETLIGQQQKGSGLAYCLEIGKKQDLTPDM